MTNSEREDESTDPGQSHSTSRFFRLKVASISVTNEFTKRLLTYCIEPERPIDVSQDETITILLRGVWTQTQLNIGNIVHLIQPQYDETNNVYTIDNSSGVLVLEPDRQISCTTITSSLFCERKSWLNSIFLTRSGVHPAQIVGTLVHDLLLHALKYQVDNTQELTKHLNEILCRPNVMLEMFATGQHSDYYREEVLKYLDNIQGWICKYVHSGSKNSLINNADQGVRLKDICDIENVVRSTRYGIKGKVDITGIVRVYDRRSKKYSDLPAAVEVKTGSSNLSLCHGAQVNLYSMILNEIYHNCDRGFVTYLKDELDMYVMHTTHHVKRDLIHKRNQLVMDFTNPFVGPALLDRTASCQPCEKLTECLVTQKLYENNLKRYPNMLSLEATALNHLEANVLQFFKRQYERFIKLHEKHLARQQSLDDFELVGEGYCRLKLMSAPHENSNGRPEFLTFQRHPEYIENYATSKRLKTTSSQQLARNASSQEATMTNNDKITIQLRPFDTSGIFSAHRVLVKPAHRRQHQHQEAVVNPSAALGVMHEISQNRLVVKLFDKRRAQTMDLGWIYRIDKVFLERESKLYTMRRNLSKLLELRSRQAFKVRQLVSDPKYEVKYNQTIRTTIEASGNEELFDLPGEQQSAIADAISAENYYILTNDRLIETQQQLHERVALLLNIIGSLNYSTVVAAQSVDHLANLMRLLQISSCQFVLMDDGKSLDVKRKFANHLIVPPQDACMPTGQKFDAFTQRHVLAPVVLTTYAVAAESLLFTRRAFDYCIAYDCDKTDVLVALAPLFCCERHIIIDMRLTQHEADRQQTLERDDIVSLGDHLRNLRQRPEIGDGGGSGECNDNE